MTRLFKIQNQQTGFSLIELIIILMLALSLIAVGVYVARRHMTNSLSAKPINSTTSSTPPADTSITRSNPSYLSDSLKNEKINFRYPSTWKLVDSSAKNHDDILFSSPNGTMLQIVVGAAHTNHCDSCKLLGSDPLTLFGQSYFFNYITTNNATLPDKAVLSFYDACGGICSIDARNLKLNDQPAKIYASVTLPQNQALPLSGWQSDSSVIAAKSILQSFSY